MGSVVHLHHSTSPDRLLAIEAEVYDAVDRMCLRVGALLAEARALDPSGFRDWVEDRLPFGYDKARRLIAIHLAYSELPENVRQGLPRPWQAMFALRHWASGRLPGAIESGEVGPDMTQSAALALAKKWSKDSRRDGEELSDRYGRVDLLAGQLMAEAAEDLNPEVARALSAWLSRRTPGPT